MKIAIYGGSFNPPHTGHVKVAEIIAEKLRPDKLLIIPDNIPPHKEIAEGSPDAMGRLEMCRLAFENVPGAEISGIELKREGKSYTSDTVDDILTEYPGSDVYLTIGSDMLLSFTEWYRFEHLLDCCTLVVLSRFGSDYAQLEAYADGLRKLYGAKVLILEHEPVITNSSIIRSRIHAGLGTEDLPPAVAKYINEHGLYR